MKLQEEFLHHQLPRIFMANVRSLKKKVYSLKSTLCLQNDFKDVCILALTETWLKDNDTGNCVSIDGFGVPLRTDRDPTVTGKKNGGGVCLYVRPEWYNCRKTESVCTKDIELLTVSLRPVHLRPCDYPQLFVTVVYIHPNAIRNNATDTLKKTVNKLQSDFPDAPKLILGDFNTCDVRHIMLDFHQYVSGPTRRNKTLDLCYGSIKDAYKSDELSPVGSSDHSAILLIPVNQKQQIKTKESKAPPAKML